MISSERSDFLESMRSDAKRLFEIAVQRINPVAAVKRFVRLSGNRLLLGPEGASETELAIDSFEHVYVIGAGKASGSMAKALEEILDGRIHGGLVVVKYGFAEPLQFLQIIEAGHPLPDQQGVQAARRIMEIMESAGEKDLVFSLISGGGSALLPLPTGGISLSEKQTITKMLLECGAAIREINAVRKHISALKGGQMARAAFPATTVNLMLSDVVGDRLDVIASGPFVPDPTTFQDACSTIQKYHLIVPSSIEEHLEKGLHGQLRETPKSGDPVFRSVSNFVVGSNIQALEAAEEEAERLGYKTLILSSMVEGETREVAHVHTAIAKEILKSGRPIPCPACIITGGETTVTIRGTGIGGRNQEFCLASAIDIFGLPQRLVIASAGTDGNDGPTEAAGAIVDPLTCLRGKKEGLDAGSFLENNDAYPFLERTGDLLFTGPTRTNVMDVRFMLLR